MSDKKEERHVRLTKPGKKLKKVNPLLNELYIGLFGSDLFWPKLNLV